MKTLEQLRDEALAANTHSGAIGQYGYAISLQMNAEDSGSILSDEEAWKKAGQYLR